MHDAKMFFISPQNLVHNSLWVGGIATRGFCVCQSSYGNTMFKNQTNYLAISKPSEIPTDFKITKKVPKVNDI